MVLGRPLPDGGTAAVMFRCQQLDDTFSGNKPCTVYTTENKSRLQMKREGDGGAGVKSCFGTPEPAPATSPNGRPTTASAQIRRWVSR